MLRFKNIRVYKTFHLHFEPEVVKFWNCHLVIGLIFKVLPYTTPMWKFPLLHFGDHHAVSCHSWWMGGACLANVTSCSSMIWFTVIIKIWVYFRILFTKNNNRISFCYFTFLQFYATYGSDQWPMLLLTLAMTFLA